MLLQCRSEKIITLKKVKLAHGKVLRQIRKRCIGIPGILQNS